jgi:hypothetical protein
MPGFRDFVLQLLVNPAAAGQFASNPQQAMASAGCSAVERALVGRLDRIDCLREALRAEFAEPLGERDHAPQRLLAFLQSLDHPPAGAKRRRSSPHDPEALMDSAALSCAERALLRSGSATALHEAVAEAMTDADPQARRSVEELVELILASRPARSVT